MAQDFFSHLSERGLVQDHTPDFQEHTKPGTTRTAYIGFDPTASSLHIGNLATLNLLVRWMKAGHKGVVLMGGATGMIGDPSGKAAERKLLDRETIEGNVAAQREQIKRYMESVDELRAPDSTDARVADNLLAVVDNYDWFKTFGFLEFLRDYGKTITVGYMMAKDSVKNRLETGLSFTEFSYQLLQAVDFLYLYKNQGVTVQMGGSDQWGNITTGTEYIRRQESGDAHALTTPLVTKSDGTKFGKSESGNVWVDAELTTPFQMYQFWLNVGDEEVERLLKVFTFLPLDSELKDREYRAINPIMEKHRENPSERWAQRQLATSVTELVHGTQAVHYAVESSMLLFGQSTFKQWQQIPQSQFLDITAGVKKYHLHRDFLDTDIITALSEGTYNQLFKSKGEARKFIAGGGLRINQQSVDLLSPTLGEHGMILDKYLIGTKGKKNFFILEIVS